MSSNKYELTLEDDLLETPDITNQKAYDEQYKQAMRAIIEDHATLYTTHRVTGYSFCRPNPPAQLAPLANHYLESLPTPNPSNKPSHVAALKGKYAPDPTPLTDSLKENDDSPPVARHIRHRPTHYKERGADESNRFPPF